MNLPRTIVGLSEFFEEPPRRLVIESETFLSEIVVPVVSVGFVFCARRPGGNSLESFPYRDAYVRWGSSYPEFAVFCYGWALERIADHCALVSLLRREGTATTIKLSQRFRLAAVAALLPP
jgi:hypothetical protein